MSLLPFLHPHLIEAGCDEAGRGCLAGPVFAAAVILPKDFSHPKLDDSKKINEKTRLALRKVIEEKALAYAVASCSPLEIDQMNILNASFEAMHRALSKLKIAPEMILVDGNRFKPYKDVPYECVIKGDGKYLSIAAASILAKTYRDDYMQQIHLQFPHYAWNSNKGYPTKSHRKAIEIHGSCLHHRQSFQLLPLPQQRDLFKD